MRYNKDVTKGMSNYEVYVLGCFIASGEGSIVCDCGNMMSDSAVIMKYNHDTEDVMTLDSVSASKLATELCLRSEEEFNKIYGAMLHSQLTDSDVHVRTSFKHTYDELSLALNMDHPLFREWDFISRFPSIHQMLLRLYLNTPNLELDVEEGSTASRIRESILSLRMFKINNDGTLMLGDTFEDELYEDDMFWEFSLGVKHKIDLKNKFTKLLHKIFKFIIKPSSYAVWDFMHVGKGNMISRVICEYVEIYPKLKPFTGDIVFDVGSDTCTNSDLVNECPKDKKMCCLKCTEINTCKYVCDQAKETHDENQ